MTSDVHLDDFGLLMAQCRPEYAAYRPGVIQQPGVEDFPLYPPIDNEVSVESWGAGERRTFAHCL